MDSGIVTEAAFLLLIVGTAIYVVILYNELVRLRNDNDRAWANIDVLLKQRHDEIPNLVETVKGYMQHEQQTLLVGDDAGVSERSCISTVGADLERKSGRAGKSRQGVIEKRGAG